MTTTSLTTLTRSLHVSHLIQCITGLPDSHVDLETSRLGVAYYALSALDLLGALDDDVKVPGENRKAWRDWIWTLAVQGEHGFGFRPGSSMRLLSDNCGSSPRYDPPHLIMTYTALLSLSILRDDFTHLDRDGLVKFLSSTQHEDGSFSPLPIGSVSSESDLRLTFCTFAICSMLDDWSGINVDKAVGFIARCRSYEGGYGEAPGHEAQGGPTYCALASLRLSSVRCDPSPSRTSPLSSPRPFLTPSEAMQTVRWLTQKQRGGFQGRTEKNPDACYCFWCGAALMILNRDESVNSDANTAFLSACQFKFGGIAKEPGDTPDPYHTYLSLAALSLYPPSVGWLEEMAMDPSGWNLCRLDPLLNLRLESAAWARQYIPRGRRETA